MPIRSSAPRRSGPRQSWHQRERDRVPADARQFDAEFEKLPPEEKRHMLRMMQLRREQLKTSLKAARLALRKKK